MNDLNNEVTRQASIIEHQAREIGRLTYRAIVAESDLEQEKMQNATLIKLLQFATLDEGGDEVADHDEFPECDSDA